MPRPFLPLFLLILAPLCAANVKDVESLLREALAAETRQDSSAALPLLQQADAVRPNDPLILQKIARQYSDLAVEQSGGEEKKKYAQIALDYSNRAVALAPQNPVNVLSLAVCHGKLALYSDTSTKVRYSRLVKEETERALALDPNYAWAHHLLGRWNYEVASLSSTSKFLVHLIYGSLPSASFDTGIRELQRAVELEPTELNHVLELGFAYAAAGEPEKARTAWTKGLAMPSRGPHDEAAKQRAREALARLN